MSKESAQELETVLKTAESVTSTPEISVATDTATSTPGVLGTAETAAPTAGDSGAALISEISSAKSMATAPGSSTAGEIAFSAPEISCIVLTAASTIGVPDSVVNATSEPRIPSIVETAASAPRIQMAVRISFLAPRISETASKIEISNAARKVASASGSSEPAAAFLPSLPPPRAIETPPGFPPNLVGRALQAAEFFHALEPGLIGAHPGQAAKAEVASVPSAHGFLAALAGTDLESFDYMYGYLVQLLRCIRSNADRDEQLSKHPIKKGNIMELVRLALAPHFGRDRSGDRLTETDLAVESLRTVDYGDLSVWQKLALIEGLSSRLLRLPAVRRWLPMARLEPLASLSDCSCLWWLRCAPDRLLIQPATTASGDGAWRYYALPEEFEALRHSATTEPGQLARLNAAIKRVLQHQRPEPAAASSAPMGAAVATGGISGAAVSEYLRSRFISRLVGTAELLHKDLPPGSCMSPHRLRHYLAGSSRPSELADCLLQFEEHLVPAMQKQGEALKLWRESVQYCGTLSALNMILESTQTANQILARMVATRHGVCGCCRDAISSDTRGGLAFCHACCVNYHRQCAELAAASARPTAAAQSHVTRYGVWLCTECRRPKEPPVKKRRLNASTAARKEPPQRQLQQSYVPLPQLSHPPLPTTQLQLSSPQPAARLASMLPAQQTQHVQAPENVLLRGCVDLRAQVFGSGPFMNVWVSSSSTMPKFPPDACDAAELSREGFNKRNLFTTLTQFLPPRQHLGPDSAQRLVPAGSSGTDAQSSENNAGMDEDAAGTEDVEMTDMETDMHAVLCVDALIGNSSNPKQP